MGKKDDLKRKFQDENEDDTIEDISDDISDDILLNEDLDDPLFAEAEALLGPIPGLKKKSIEKKVIKNKKGNSNQKSTSQISLKPQDSAEMIKEFSIFLLKKAKIYEEIGFDTILRKFSSNWNLSKPQLVDVLENIIENKVISSIDLKMTANSLKFYSKRKK